MPKTAMNEDNLLQAREDKVGFARQVLPVQPIAVAHRMNKAAHHHLRHHSLGLDVGHDFATPLGTYCVGHRLSSDRVSSINQSRKRKRGFENHLLKLVWYDLSHLAVIC